DYWNGSAWVNLGNTAAALFNEAANAPVGWYPAKTISLPAAAQINGLKLRFVRNVGGTVTIRVDDVVLTGTPAVVGSCGTNVSVSSSVTASCGPAWRQLWYHAPLRDGDRIRYSYSRYECRGVG
ncbi:MAG: hypothetical protein EB101_11820, partial [Chitinophagia bacterium]|nr:hypothetical protein [Chitinophagia bacterium]